MRRGAEEFTGSDVMMPVRKGRQMAKGRRLKQSEAVAASRFCMLIIFVGQKCDFWRSLTRAWQQGG